MDTYIRLSSEYEDTDTLESVDTYFQELQEIEKVEAEVRTESNREAVQV